MLNILKRYCYKLRYYYSFMRSELIPVVSENFA